MTSDFWRGFFGVFTAPFNMDTYVVRKTTVTKGYLHKSDAEALRSDWDAVGRDMRNAIRQVDDDLTNLFVHELLRIKEQIATIKRVTEETSPLNIRLHAEVVKLETMIASLKFKD